MASMIAFDIDKILTTDEERSTVLNIVYAQAKELVGIYEVRVTCPCGASEMILLACRCHFCGVFFCRSCAAWHFGKQS